MLQLAHRAVALVAVLVVGLGPLAMTGAAAGTLTMSARILLQGHARAGAWSAIEVQLQNDGPSIDGELRMDGGSEARARFAMAVTLPTGSRQTYVLHVQPPAFGRSATVQLVSNGNVLDSVDVAYLVHDTTQLVVGVLAERPQGLIAQIKLPNNQTGTAPAIVPLTVADLPERAEGWGALDRLVWQDVDSNQLSTGQLDALRRWVSAGGRLVIVGGTAGIATLSAFPDDLLPYRPTATVDLDPGSLTSLLGTIPAGATVLPAMGGAPARGRALVTSGTQVVAGELGYGSGRITLLGFDPTTRWLADSRSVSTMWQALLPGRTVDGSALFDDSQLLQAVYQLPALALPPTAGLLGIIAAYILIIGPINYLILRRLDRRELAWITMPVLVIAFSSVSFGYGALLRGTDVVVNEVAIVRGAPDATEATAQVYFGVFSPTRSTYQLQVPGDALLASPLSGDQFGQQTDVLDILQGTGTEVPSAVRNLTVGTGSLRVIRAQVAASAPRIRASLSLSGGNLTGTVENASDETIEGAAVALGSSVLVLGDLTPHGSKPVSLAVQNNAFGAGLADQVVGQGFDASNEASIKRSIRYQMVNQLVWDPTGGSIGQLPGDQAVFLGFGEQELLDVKVGSEEPRRNGNVLWYVPIPVAIHGKVTFSSDLLHASVVDSDSPMFSKDRFFINLGAGTTTFAYRPVTFDGTFTVSEIRMLVTQGGSNGLLGSGKVIEPLPSVAPACTDQANTTPPGCRPPRQDFLPEVEVFDRTGGGAWVRLPQLAAETSYDLANPARYVDPATGQMLVRFVNENLQSSLGFGFQLALIGDVQ